MPTRRPEPQCSFCGKTQSEVGGRLIAGDSVFICVECTALCHELLQEEQRPGEVEKELLFELPIPTPKTNRPFESWSIETVSRATFQGLRRGKGVTRAPIRIRVVFIAIAAKATHGSTIFSG